MPRPSNALARVLLPLALLAAVAVPTAAPTPVEAATTAPGESTAQVLWESDFRDHAAALQSLGGERAAWDGKENSTFAPHGGKDAWSIRAAADTRNGSKVRARFEDLGFQPQGALRLEYDVFVPSEAALSLDLKLPGFGSLPAGRTVWDASSGGSKRPDSASIRIHARPAGHWGMTRPYLEAYAYAHSGGGKTFQDWGLYWRLSKGMNATGPAHGDELPIPIGAWSNIVIEAEMNTPGRSDGALRVWLNGEQGVGLDDLRWVDAAPHAWTQTVFETFYNVGSHPAATLRVADMRFSTPCPPAGVTTAAPTTPTTAPMATPPTTVAATAPSALRRWSFTNGVEGWSSSQKGVSVRHETRTAQGAGALRGTMAFPRKATGTMRLQSSTAGRDWSAGGSELGTWVHLPKGAGGTAWKARIEVQDRASYGFTRGALTDLVPGRWTWVAHDFGTRLDDVHRVVVQIQAWDVGATRSLILDSVEQR